MSKTRNHRESSSTKREKRIVSRNERRKLRRVTDEDEVPLPARRWYRSLLSRWS